ncbi:hypothetical protein HYW17_04750 [Candidatus Uhrbacteria bacterium]|nr:hypothetical protein [Candidatus Uhrbacteria bacterium]
MNSWEVAPVAVLASTLVIVVFLAVGIAAWEAHGWWERRKQRRAGWN